MRRRGATLLEVITASSVSILVLFAGVFIFLTGMTSWARGEGRMDAEGQSSRAIRTISTELREAMLVTVDANGQGLTYRLPTRGSDGRYTTPVLWDGVNRRIELSGTNLEVVTGSTRRIICGGVITTDPNASIDTAYRIFTPGPGSVTRSITVMIANRRAAERSYTTTSRSRERIYLRNIPELVR